MTPKQTIIIGTIISIIFYIFFRSVINLSMSMAIEQRDQYRKQPGQLIYKGASVSIYREIINGQTCEVARNGLMQQIGEVKCL